MNWALYAIAAVIAAHLLVGITGVIIVQAGGELPQRSKNPAVHAAASMLTIAAQAAIVVVIVLAALRLS